MTTAMDRTTEAPSRIFTRNLPPSITEADFRKHFAQRFPTSITDLKLFPQRRIGYVGFKTPEDATTAVKYFNKSFIRMSRINVELASAPQAAAPKHAPPTAKRPATVKEDHENLEQTPSKRRRIGEEVDKDPKLKEYLEAMKAPSKKSWVDELPQPDVTATDAEIHSQPDITETSVPKKRRKLGNVDDTSSLVPPEVKIIPEKQDGPTEKAEQDTPQSDQPVDDLDWMRSRTNRLLGLVDDDEETDQSRPSQSVPTGKPAQQPTPPPEEDTVFEEEEGVDDDADESSTEIKAVRDSRRLFLRNLPYSAQEEDLRELFASKGALQEVHVPLDSKTGNTKGFAFVHYEDPEDAVQAYTSLDGTTFQGRLLHILPAAVKRETKLDEFAISKLPVKKQRLLEKKAQASSSTFNWNSLYMNQDAVMSSIADRLGASKSELFDPTSSDAAVRQAQAETHIIQETKAFFEENGVDLNAFSRKERGDMAILVKNFPYGTKADDLKTLFGEVGEVSRVLMPPSGTIAIVEFPQKTQARAAFATFSYRKYKDSVLFLEKAPKDLFKPGMHRSNVVKIAPSANGAGSETTKLSTTDLLQPEYKDEHTETSTLFVRNLNFSTTNERLEEVFKPLDGFMSARVKTKTDAKKPGQVLSMGFGFVEFRSKEQAQAALKAMDGFSLEGHYLIVKASHKGNDAAEAQRKEDDAKKQNARKAKLIIKNLPFEASKKDVRALFKTYGQLRSVRVPNKFDGSRKGYAFAEFTTPKEAENAMDALRNTHFLGRRLVLDFAEGDLEDAEAEIEKMQQKVGRQTNTIAMQRLTASSDRKKFTIGDGNDGVDG